VSHPETDANDRLFDSPKQERVFPDRYVVEDGDLREWLDTTDLDAERLVLVERLRRENPETWTRAAAACRTTTTRAVLAALVHEGGSAVYDDLTAYTSKTRRTVRNHVYDLRDDDVVAVEDGRPAILSFPDEPTEILVEDALSVFYEA